MAYPLPVQQYRFFISHVPTFLKRIRLAYGLSEKIKCNNEYPLYYESICYNERRDFSLNKWNDQRSILKISASWVLNTMLAIFLNRDAVFWLGIYQYLNLHEITKSV